MLRSIQLWNNSLINVTAPWSEYSTSPKSHTAAAAKSLQPCLTLCDPIDSSPPGSPVPGILQERTLEWIAISFSNAWKWKVKGKSLSRVWLFSTPWIAAHQAPPSMGFSRQEHWSGESHTTSTSKNYRCLDLYCYRFILSVFEFHVESYSPLWLYDWKSILKSTSKNRSLMNNDTFINNVFLNSDNGSCKAAQYIIFSKSWRQDPSLLVCLCIPCKNVFPEQVKIKTCS